MRNTWLWFHILGGGFLAKVFMWLFGKIQKKYDRKHLAILVVLFIAVGWEVLEYSMGIQNYGNDMKRFLIDAIQDIAGAVIMALIVVA